MEDTGQKRIFTTGATRDTASGKHDFEGFLSPLVLEAYGTYMNFNRQMADGTTRDSDNWQKGIPPEAYMKSGWRHLMDWWRGHRGLTIKENMVWALCGVIFNASGYLHEYLKSYPTALDDSLRDMTNARKGTAL
jgi:hypothetical protein